MDTKKLRQKILDLAIHGKLVAQNPNDEPASELLKRINPKAEIISNSDKYGNLPNGWCACRLKDILKITMGQSPKGESINQDKGIEFHQGKIHFSNKYLQHSNLFTNMPTKIADADSLLLCVRAPVGIVNITKHKICIGRGLCSLKPFYDNVDFFFYLLQTLHENFEKKATGTTFKAISSEVVKNEIIHLPPLAEQKRIVEAIDKWFALIDSIENNKADLETTIKQTKSKILDLAIHGKLVAQNPNDEPASELLKRINPKAEIISNSEQYENLPNGWCLTKTKNVFLINPKNKIDDALIAGFIPMASIKEGFCNNFTYEEREWNKIKNGFTHFADGDIAVAKISPCLENRKSVVLNNLPNKIGAGTTELHVFRPLCTTSLFGLWFFKSDYFINSCINTFNGVVGQQRVGKNIIENLIFPLPPLAEQKRIVEAIDKAFKYLDAIVESL